MWREHRDGEDLWIGLHKTTRWCDDNASTYRNWVSGEPNEEATCIRYKYSRDGFADRACNERYRFICKKLAGMAHPVVVFISATWSSVTERAMSPWW